MKKIHIANTNFEWECEQKSIPDLPQSLRQHPHFLQLQFLPLLYADNGELIAVTDRPFDDKRFLLFSEKKPLDATIESFAPSRAIKVWADQRGYRYEIPPWELIVELCSKELSFALGRPPMGSLLLYDETEVRAWIEKTPGKKVLKSCFGVSGNGHRFIEDELAPHHLRFLRIEWSKKLPVIGEPWVERILDFSSHWHVGDDIAFRGAIKTENDARGGYRKTVIAPLELLFGDHLSRVEAHLDFVKPLLAGFQARGFFGPIGFDAMLYREVDEIKLQPLVEINPRMTMGSIALNLTNPNALIEIEYRQGNSGLLPNQLNGISFNRNLFLSQKSINL